MGIVVLKFGGSSLATTKLIQEMAAVVSQHLEIGEKPVVVVSAMGGETDRLIALAQSIRPEKNAAYDTIVAAGEQISTGLMALALEKMGNAAVPLQGWQLPITTTNQPAKAHIKSIQTEKVRSLVAQGIIPVIAGFQGLSEAGDITTFGRGGSDLTAVALACALRADSCILYKDVPGILSADPRVIPKAQLRPQVSFDEMLELSGLGSKVIQSRAVEMAMRHGVPLQVNPTDMLSSGTSIQVVPLSEEAHVRGIVLNDRETKITLVEASTSISIKAQLFHALAQENIIIDMIIQHGANPGVLTDDLSFTVGDEDSAKTIALCEKLQKSLQYKKIVVQDRVAKISVVGSGMRGHTQLACKLFQELANLGVTTFGVSTSELKLSVLIGSPYGPTVAKALHRAFDLDESSKEKDLDVSVA